MTRVQIQLIFYRIKFIKYFRARGHCTGTGTWLFTVCMLQKCPMVRKDVCHLKTHFVIYFQQCLPLVSVWIGMQHFRSMLTDPLPDPDPVQEPEKLILWPKIVNFYNWKILIFVSGGQAAKKSVLHSICKNKISRDRDCYGLVEIGDISGGRQVFGLRQIFDHFEHGGPVQTADTVREESPPIKAGHWRTILHLESTCTRFNTSARRRTRPSAGPERSQQLQIRPNSKAILQ